MRKIGVLYCILLAIFFKGICQEKNVSMKSGNSFYLLSGLFGTRQNMISQNEGGFTAGIGFSKTIKALTYSGEFLTGSAIELFADRYNEYQINFLVGKIIKTDNRIVIQPNIGIGYYNESKKNGYTNFKYETTGVLGLLISIRALYLLKNVAIGLNFATNYNSLVTAYSYTFQFNLNL